MLTKLIAISLILLTTTQQCVKGCLMCSRLSECLFPDIFNNYKLTDNTPKKVELINCAFVDLDGRCLKCIAGTYYDPTVDYCMVVHRENMVSNCAIYATFNTCLICKPRFHEVEGECNSVENVINKCLTYSTDKNCSSCEEGFVLAVDELSCIPAPSINNCQSFSWVNCIACKSGFVRNYNQYLNFLNRNELEEFRESFNFYDYHILTNPTTLVAQRICQSIESSNCVVYRGDSCAECEEGFTFDQKGTCVENPKEPILNCEKYSTATECVECKTKFLLSNNKCTLISDKQLLDNCKRYKGSSSVVSCKECEAEFFLKSGGGCQPRQESLIPNCMERVVEEDKCKKCLDGYMLTDDQLDCQKKQSNCLVFLPSKKGEVIRCQTCESGYYFNEIEVTDFTQPPLKECLRGSITHCSVFAIGDKNVCLECKNGYVLKSGRCEESNFIDGCDVYSKTDKTVCEKCFADESFKFSFTKKCAKIVTPIPSCVKYSGGNVYFPKCSQCVEDSMLYNNTCLTIPIANCEKISESFTCLKCKDKYGLANDSLSCLSALDYINDNCHTTSLINKSVGGPMTEAKCTACLENAYPMNFKGHFACIANSNITQLKAGFTKVNNCIKYDSDLNCVQCFSNSEKKFLRVENGVSSCVSTCKDHSHTAAYNKLVLANNAQTHYEISQWDVCVDSPVSSNCYVQGPDLDSSSIDTICLSCLPDNAAVVSLTDNSCSLINPNTNLLFPYVVAPFQAYPKVSCVSKAAGVTFGDSTEDIDQNCEFFIQASGTHYTCIRCKFGYRSIPDGTGSLISCIADGNSSAGCSTNKLNNLGVFWEKLFSCNVCNDSNRIPFIAYSVTSITDPTFVRFEKWNTTKTSGTYASTTGSEKSIVCLSNSPSSFGIADSSDYGISPHCALGVVLTNTNGVTDYTLGSPTYTTTCAACKPGYSKVDADSSQFAKDCVVINNCARSENIANACLNCAPDYILRHENDDIVFTHPTNTCIALPAIRIRFNNCLAASANDQNIAEECKVCKKGYHLNKDSVCEEISPTHCKSGKFKVSEKMLKKTLKWSLYYQEQGAGCNECDVDYLAVKIEQEKGLCVLSSWLLGEVQHMTNSSVTNYIPHCKHYDATKSGSLVCVECKAGYVINGLNNQVLGTTCFNSNSLPNCVLAENKSKCLQCKSQNYGLANSTCQQGQINNCIAYNHKEDQSVVNCVTCQNGFFITFNNTCEEGQVENCLEYVDKEPKTCKRCKDYHFVISIRGGDYCYPFPQELNFNSPTIDPSTQSIISFDGCVDTSTYVELDLQASDHNHTCLFYSKLDFCDKYDVDQILSFSSFSCTKCKKDFYLDLETFKCENRKNLSEQCQIYHDNQDKCLECGERYYVSNDSAVCKPFPNGILGCRVYLNLFTCSGCKENQYLSNNECHDVKPGIDGCLYYQDNNTCVECKSGYRRSNGLCEQANAKNCLTYNSLNACSSCEEGLLLFQEGDIVSCIKQTTSLCAESSNTAPYKCKRCKPGFYLSSDGCQQPTSNIDNCIEYASKDTCKRCVSGTALTTNKKSCTRNGLIGVLTDTNCYDSAIVAEPICTVCGPGYRLIGNECVVACEGENKEGCFSCSSINPTVCQICKAGYYHNSSYNCIVNEDIIKPDEPTTETIESDTKSTHLLSITTLLALYLINYN